MCTRDGCRREGGPRVLARLRLGNRHETWHSGRMLETPRTLSAEPRAHERPTTSTWHGVTLTDEYAWLKAPNWQEVMRDPLQLDPAIRAYLEAENAYCAAL